MNRFTSVANKPYIDPFTPLPLEFMQGVAEKKQAAYDAGKTALNEAQESYLGITPGMLTKDKYFQDFRQKYDGSFEELSERLLKDPNSAKKVAFEIAQMKSKINNDPLAKAIKQDYEYTQDFAKKTVGSPVDYVLRNDKPLSYDAMGNPIMPTPELYGIAKDEDVTGTLLKEVHSYLKPNIYKNDTGGYTVSLFNPSTQSYDVFQVDTSEQVKKLTREKIGEFVKDNETRFRDKAFYNFVKEAERRGNRDLINDPNFTNEIFNQLVEPAYNLAFEERDIDNNYKLINQSLSNATTKKPGESSSTDNDPNTPIIKTTVGVGVPTPNYYNPNNSSEVKTIYTPTEANESLININNSQKGLMANLGQKFLNYTNNQMPLGFKNTPEYFTDFIKNNFEFGPYDTFVSKDPRFQKLAEDLEFKQAATQMLNLQDLKIRTEAFKSSIEKHLPKLSQEEEAEFNTLIKTANEYKNNKEGYSSDIEATIGNFIEEGIFNINKFLNEGIKKTSPNVQKYYEAYEKIANKQYNQNYISLETSKASDELKTTLINSMVVGSKAFKDLATDKVLNDDQLKEFKNLLPLKGESGKETYDLSQITVGFTYDPKDGLVGVLSSPNGAINIEFKNKDFNIREIAKYVSPNDFKIIELYENTISELYKNPGRKGNINFYGFDFEAELDPSTEQFVWKDIDGKLNYTPDASNMINYYIEKNKLANQIKQQTINNSMAGFNIEQTKIRTNFDNGNISQIEMQNKLNDLNRKRNLLIEEINNENPMVTLGKLNPQTQKEGVLGITFN